MGAPTRKGCGAAPDFTLPFKKRVGTWASLEDGQAHVPTLLSEEWARGRDHMCKNKLLLYCVVYRTLFIYIRKTDVKVQSLSCGVVLNRPLDFVF